MEPRLSYLVGRLERVLRRQLNEALGAHGLTISEYTTLSVLRTRGGLSNAQLARRSLITPQSMSEVLAGLVARGYVRRKADPGHGRIIRTELTASGSKALVACDEAVDEIERRMLLELDAQDGKRLIASLTSCVRMLGGGLADP